MWPETGFAVDSLLERDGFEPSVPLAINAVGGTVCRGSAQPCHAYPQVGAGAVRSFRPRSGSCRPNRLLLTIGRMHSTASERGLKRSRGSALSTSSMTEPTACETQPWPHAAGTGFQPKSGAQRWQRPQVTGYIGGKDRGEAAGLGHDRVGPWSSW